jgi:TonB family protein
MPSNPWRCADFLERVRPGFAISVALHIGLFLLLAYLLAFQPSLQVQPKPDNDVIIIVDPPKPPPPVMKHDNPSSFHPSKAPTLDPVTITPGTLTLPPDLSEQWTQSTGTGTGGASTAPTVIINPKPIYRGGLVFPARAEEAGVSGYVDFDFIIEPDGTVGDPHVIAEIPDGYGFATAAKKAFPKWRFEPMMKDGHPVATPAKIRVTFKLN